MSNSPYECINCGLEIRTHGLCEECIEARKYDRADALEGWGDPSTPMADFQEARRLLGET